MEMDELVEAFLLRLPPDDRASLVRAALVCKFWRRILADRGFRRRFCELHRRPPMLGFLYYLRNEAWPYFTHTSSFRLRNADLRGLYAIDSRHGRVLVARSLLFSLLLESNRSLAVWDPISGDWLELPKLQAPQHLGSIGIFWNAAVLCASNPSSACDSIDCHLGHFLVFLMATSQHRAYVYVYSSQAGTWSETTSAAQDPLDPNSVIPLERSALATNALYFKIVRRLSSEILKYDLDMQEISWINLPSNYEASEILLTTTEYGGLGIARVERGSSRLHLWSGEAGRLVLADIWDGHQVESLNSIRCSLLIPYSIDVVAFLYGLGAFLVNTNDGVFNVDLESNQSRKVFEDSCSINVIPYMCFCTPDVTLTHTGEGPGASVPSA